MKGISSSPRVGAGARNLCPLPRLYASTPLRIHVFWLLLAWTPAVSQAYCYSSCYGGVHYSPYALSYYSSGLVPCGVEYSPYALSYGQSGLIYECTQFTPYTFSYYNSGLVPGYGICYPGSYWGYGYPAFRVRRGPAPHIIHRPAHPVRRCAQDTARPDGMDIIRQHLKARGFASVNIDRILRVDNQLVSVDFLVKDRNLLIKYWNPQEMERVGTKETFKQKACAKYKESWERYAREYKQKGGAIYVVNASEPQTIVAALESCTRLAPGLKTPARQTMYAKE